MMEEMIARWIRETIYELEQAKKDENLHKMYEMKRLHFALKAMRKKLGEN
ncbi:MAG: hypothetical protein NDI69_15145 [Bacteriovoracaceae bacterium]|nr:hypothetical protein [Bacteriovoracaceae bacterium]